MWKIDTSLDWRMGDRDGRVLGPTADFAPAAPSEIRPPVRPVRLSVLEIQVLADVASGWSNKEIADRLGYSMYYVKDVVAGARRRLAARDRAHAAARAVSLYLIEDDGTGSFRPTRLGGGSRPR